MAVADFLETLEMWLPLENFDNAECIWRQCVEMFLMKCAGNVRKARKKGSRGNERLVTDLAEHAGKKAKDNLPKLPNSTFLFVIR